MGHQNSVHPLPIYDNLEYLVKQELSDNYQNYQKNDFKFAKEFLLQYIGSIDTFNAYRRELEKLTQWAWLVEQKPFIEFTRQDIEKYIEFCQKPPKNWISLKNVPRFLYDQGIRKANPQWCPFVATIAKSEIKKGKKPSKDDFQLSQTSLKELFAINSSFYNYLIQMEVRESNPLLQIRQKSKYLQKKQQSVEPIRRLSTLQWSYIINTATAMAEKQPEKYERTYFIMTVLYGMYLRISELVVTKRWQPKMNDFYRDADGLWWFRTVGKGNKMREISVSDAVLNALKRWRTFLGLPSALPTPADNTPLLPKEKGTGGLSDTRHVRGIVQECFDLAMEKMRNSGLAEEADSMQNATVHWLRHTGISDDVKIRPREHVRDDAGHSSGAITDRYINIERQARHASAKKKPIKISRNDDVL